MCQRRSVRTVVLCLYVMPPLASVFQGGTLRHHCVKHRKERTAIFSRGLRSAGIWNYIAIKRGVSDHISRGEAE